MMSRLWSRTIALLASAGIAVLTVLSPAPPVSAAPPIQISFWHFMSGGAGVNLVQMINDFNRTHHDIHVNALLVPWGVPFYSKLSTSVAAHKAPDVITLHLSRLPYFAAKGVLDPLTTQELSAHGLTQRDFVPALWTEARYNGTQYAVPLDTHPQVLYYNTRLAKQAGLLGANGLLQPITSAATFMQDCRLIKQKTGKWCVAFMNNDPVGIWRTWYALYRQQDANVLSNNGQQVVLDTHKAQRALDFMLTLVKDGYAPKHVDYATMVALFGSQKAAFEINGEWEIPTYQGKLSYDMALFPQIFSNADTWADAHSFAIPANNGMDARTRQAVLTFIAFMEQHVLTWAEGGLQPAYLPVLHSSAFQHYLPLAHVAGQEARHLVFDPPSSYSGAASPLEADAPQPLVGAFLGKTTPATAIQQFASKLRDLAGAGSSF